MVAASPTRKKEIVRFEFVVEIMSPKENLQVRNLIAERGGRIVDYINEERLPYMVISDHPITKKLQAMDMAEREKISARLPLLIKDAIQNKVKIFFSNTFLKKMAADKNIKLCTTTQIAQKRSYPPDSEASEASSAAFYMRVEDMSNEFQPMLKRIDELPILHVGQDYGISLFHRADDTLRKKRSNEIQKEMDGEFSYLDVDTQGVLVNRAREKTAGYCEICRKHITNLKEHHRSKEHQKSISRPGFYDELDQYTGSYVPFINCPGRPQLLAKTPSPVTLRGECNYGETDFGKLDDDMTDSAEL